MFLLAHIPSFMQLPFGMQNCGTGSKDNELESVIRA